MAQGENSEGPVFVWTFPLITRIQSGNGLLNLGSSAMAVSETVDDMRESGPVRDRLTGDDEEEDEISELEDELDSVSETSDSIFSQSDGEDYGQAILEDNIVEIADGTFIPIRLEVDVGDEVTWENTDDSTHRVVSSEGADFSSEQLEPGDTFTQTFREEGVTTYFDSIEGQGQMCGAIIVGDVELDRSLPCEEEPDRQLLQDRQLFTQNDDSRRTMSAAVEDKEDMDVGFSND